MADSSPLAHSPTLTATEPSGDTRQLAAGTKVGDYVIERVIGAGAMGEVYAGKHPVIGKRVAIKVLRHELAASPEAAERFIREARAVNQIDHENVIDVFAFGRLDDGRLYLVMDLVEGKSLRAHLVNGPLPLDRALAILDTVADALDAAHDKGVVHRDLKPDNIVIAESGKLFVLDFGIAKLVSKAVEAGEAAKPGTLTGQGTWLGTPAYMAPEQWSADGAGPASDRYALAVIAFELLAGAPPFSATSVPGMMEQHFRADIPTLNARGASDLPTALDDVLKRGLAKDPDARFPTARGLVDALRNAAGTAVHRARATVAPPAGNRKLMMPAAIGTGVLGVAIVVIFTTRDKDTKPTRKEPAITSGQAISITTTPSEAEVRTDRVLGLTPFTMQLRNDEPLAVTLTKPGYLAKQVSIAESAHFDLDEVTQFQGVWRMTNGELRAFERRGEEVSVFKLREVAGEREFFKNYKFTGAQQGVAFASDDEVIDQRAPNDPRCHVPVRVEYHYDPGADALEQKREKVAIDFVHGSCVVRSRDAETTQLVRVDAAHETVEISAPAGIPTKTKATKKKVVPLDPKAELEKQKAAKNVKSAPPPSKSAQNVVQKPTTTYNDPGDMQAQAPPIDTGQQVLQPNAPPQQAMPPPQAPQKSQRTTPPTQQQAMPVKK